MTTPDDPLAASEAIDRAYYAVGVMLDAGRLGDEQTYHRGRLARALAYLHGTGTVAGLLVRYDPALAPGADPSFPNGRDEQISVEPGLAVDPFGRLVELPAEACLRVQPWFDGMPPGDLDQAVHGAPYSGVVADLFLSFAVFDRGLTPSFATGPFEALDAVVPSRLQDGYALTLVLRKETTPPTPATPWPTLSASDAVADRPAKLKQAIYNAWRGDRATLTAALEADPMLPAGLDPASIFLARIAITATQSTPPGGKPIRGTVAPAVTVNNDIRPFAVTALAIARWLGI
jgi:hypothetical protein